MSNAQLEEELKTLIVETLMLEEVTADEIDSNEPLFGEGLGLDSIDALELGMAVSKKYKIKINQDSEENRSYFESVSSLAQFIENKLQEVG